MPVRDRRFYIHEYNKYIEKRNNEMSNDRHTTSTYDINAATDEAQGGWL